jgi:hypothetical protein
LLELLHPARSVLQGNSTQSCFQCVGGCVAEGPWATTKGVARQRRRQ